MGNRPPKVNMGGPSAGKRCAMTDYMSMPPEERYNAINSAFISKVPHLRPLGYFEMKRRGDEHIFYDGVLIELKDGRLLLPIHGSIDGEVGPTEETATFRANLAAADVIICCHSAYISDEAIRRKLAFEIKGEMCVMAHFGLIMCWENTNTIPNEEAEAK